MTEHISGLQVGSRAFAHAHGEGVHGDWRRQLPVLAGSRVTLRELRLSDAPSLFALLTTEEVSRFISTPPDSVEAFERFIEAAHRQQADGACAFFAVTVEGFDSAIGVFQVRRLDADFSIAEWGFAIGAPFWGTGVFRQGAGLILEFAFETLGVHRLEARVAVGNERGNRAMLKLGAVTEGVLHQSFYHRGEHHDQMLYALGADDWWASRGVVTLPAVFH
jgi:ribosomal-protein-alanine N-acetyltransferase